MAVKGRKVEAVAYIRTSSAANVGADKDSDKRQRAAIEGYAKRAGFVLIDEFNDAAVSGADPIETRPGFAALMDRIEGNGVRTVIVEDASCGAVWRGPTRPRHLAISTLDCNTLHL